jgi:hypothetical protein
LGALFDGGQTVCIFQQVSIPSSTDERTQAGVTFKQPLLGRTRKVTDPTNIRIRSQRQREVFIS